MIIEGFDEGFVLSLCFQDLEDKAYNLKSGGSDEDMEKYLRMQQIIEFYVECIGNKRRKLDWKWLHEEGRLSERNYGRFAKELNDAGVDAEKEEEKMRKQREYYIQKHKRESQNKEDLNNE